MPTLSQIKVGNTTYDICDVTARQKILKHISGHTTISGTGTDMYYSNMISEKIPSGVSIVTAEITAPPVATSNAVRNFYYGGQYSYDNGSSWQNSAQYVTTFSINGTYIKPYISVFYDSNIRSFRFYRQTNKATTNTNATSVNYHILYTG